MAFRPPSRAVVSSVPGAITTRITRLGSPRSLPSKAVRMCFLLSSPRPVGMRAVLLSRYTPCALESRTNMAT